MSTNDSVRAERADVGSRPASAMTIRQAFAAMAMSGLMANPDCSGKWAGFAADALDMADALIAALAKGAGDAKV